MNRTGMAVWSGGLKDGKGWLSTESKTLSETPYSFSARFKDGSGTNPEELIAAAHAGCFTMDLSGRLGAAGMKPEEMVAVGDGFNDLSMIQFAGLGIAMANAQDVVKKAADYVTLSNEEDGVAAVVEKFFWE